MLKTLLIVLLISSISHAQNSCWELGEGVSDTISVKGTSIKVKDGYDITITEQLSNKKHEKSFVDSVIKNGGAYIKLFDSRNILRMEGEKYSSCGFIGKVKFYNEFGNLTHTEFYSFGTCDNKTNGIRIECSRWEYFDDKGNLTESRCFFLKPAEDDIAVGRVDSLFSKDGLVKEIRSHCLWSASCTNSKYIKEGAWIKFGKNAKIKKIQMYRNDQLISGNIPTKSKISIAYPVA